MTAAEAAELTPVLERIKVPGADTTLQGKAAAALDYTAMRERQVAETDARVLIGGRLSGQTGRWPGVVEVLEGRQASLARLSPLVEKAQAPRPDPAPARGNGPYGA